MDLFEETRTENRKKALPLASRMRPRNLDEYIGQGHIVGKGCLLRRAIEADRLSSIIFYGPPGVGKTSLARVIAGTTESKFITISAVTSGISDIKQVLSEARHNLDFFGRRTVLFIDEIHRFNKSQQDALLPSVEDGLVILIGATTENPFFEVNSALISRSRIFKLEHLASEDIEELIELALNDNERGLGEYQAKVTDEALDHFVLMANGDARTALNAIELAVLTTEVNEAGIREITLAIAEESIQQKALNYDKTGDNHYDIISAFIKSMRGSDPDATLHWLARMIDAGEKPEFIARRIVIAAAEDVGLADPHALQVAVSAADAVHFIGMPEGRIVLSEAALYVASAPKSNAAYLGIDEALADLRGIKFSGVPVHLRDAHYKGAKKLGHGKGYKYPHDYEGAWVEQSYLPEELKFKRYYRPRGNGVEAKIREKLNNRKGEI